ncbi:MAG: S8 family serine peptidase, partial [Actinomycetota bacterium]
MKRSPRLPLSLLAACSAAAVAVALVPSAGAAGAATTPKARARTAHAASGARPRFRDDRVLVRFKPGARAELRSRALGAAPMQPSPSAQAQSASDVEVVPVPKGHVATELQRLRADPSVAHAQPDYLYYADSVTPNDADYTAEWGLGSIRAPEAWTTTTGDGSGAGPVVAVLDSGVDYTHPDLAANVWTNVGGVAGCASGTHGFNAITGSCDPRDDNGHGTHVSGTIGAVGGNGIGVVGVNWRARIMGVKFLDSRGEGDDFAAIDAIDWIISAKAAGVNVRVINASWGGPGLDPILDDAIARAFNAGILFVAAAGNDGTNNDAAPVDPCNATHVVCVAATDSLGNLAWFSNTGPTKVDLAAPGQGIVSTWPGGGYQVEDGTSMATPHVSGAAALVLAAEPGLLVDQLTARLLASTDGSLGGQIAHGVLDVCKAVAGCGTVPAVSPTPPLDLAVHRVNGTAMVAWNAPASNGGNPITGYGVTGSNGYSVSPVGRSVTVTGLGTAGASVTFSVRAKSGGHSSDPGSVRAVMLGGGYTLDAFGGLHP